MGEDFKNTEKTPPFVKGYCLILLALLEGPTPHSPHFYILVENSLLSHPEEGNTVVPNILSINYLHLENWISY